MMRFKRLEIEQSRAAMSREYEDLRAMFSSHAVELHATIQRMVRHIGWESEGIRLMTAKITKSTSFKLAWLAPVAAVALAACGGGDDAPATTAESPAAVSDEIKTVVETRQGNFKEIAKNFKALNGELKAGAPTSDKALAAIDVITPYGPQIPTWFPEGSGPSTGLKMEAKAEIWEKPELFAEKAQAFEDAAAALATAREAEDADMITAAVGGLGKTCKGCHDNFKED